MYIYIYIYKYIYIKTYPRRLPVVGKLEHVHHIRRFLLQDILPGNVWELPDLVAERIVVLLEPFSRQERIIGRDIRKLELGRLWSEGIQNPRQSGLQQQ